VIFCVKGLHSLRIFLQCVPMAKATDPDRRLLMRAIKEWSSETDRAGKNKSIDPAVRDRLCELRDEVNRLMERVFGSGWETIEYVGRVCIDAIYQTTAMLVEPPHTRTHTASTTRPGHFASQTPRRRNQWDDKIRPIH